MCFCLHWKTKLKNQHNWLLSKWLMVSVFFSNVDGWWITIWKCHTQSSAGMQTIIGQKSYWIRRKLKVFVWGSFIICHESVSKVKSNLYIHFYLCFFTTVNLEQNMLHTSSLWQSGSLELTYAIIWGGFPRTKILAVSCHFKKTLRDCCGPCKKSA